MRLNKAIVRRINIIGNNIRYYRKQRDLTQEQLAYASYIRSRSYISMIENGHFTPSLGMLLSISDVLGVSPAFLLVDGDSDDEFLKMYKNLKPRNKTEVKRYMKYLLLE